MSKFWDLYEKNVVISGTLAIILVVTVCTMAVMQIPVPDFLSIAMGTVLGYFFGAGKMRTAVQTLKPKPTPK